MTLPASALRWGHPGLTDGLVDDLLLTRKLACSVANSRNYVSTLGKTWKKGSEPNIQLFGTPAFFLVLRSSWNIIPYYFLQ